MLKTLKNMFYSSARCQFLLYEQAKMNEVLRCQGLEGDENQDVLQTLSSFDYQWENLSEGNCTLTCEVIYGC